MTPVTLTVCQVYYKDDFSFFFLSSTLHRFSPSDVSQLIEELLCVPFNVVFFPVFSARSERYHHLASDEDEETNDEESSLEIRQFASWSHRFSKVKTHILDKP